MGHIYKEIKGNDQVIAWQVGEVVDHVKRHSKVPDVLKPFIDQGILNVIGHTNGTITVVVLTPGETQGELHRDDMLLIRIDVDDSLAVMAGYQFHNQWEPTEEWVNAEPIEVPDHVNHPSHYTQGKIEVWDFIIDQDLDYCSGNVIKYICRAGKKEPMRHIEDLEKAKAYLERRIRQVKEQ